MRTLKEIDEQIAADTAQVVDENISLLISESDARWLQSELRFGEKYREMYGILQVLEKYLEMASTDGKPERQILRKQLKQMLDTL